MASKQIKIKNQFLDSPEEAKLTFNVIEDRETYYVAKVANKDYLSDWAIRPSFELRKEHIYYVQPE